MGGYAGAHVAQPPRTWVRPSPGQARVCEDANRSASHLVPWRAARAWVEAVSMLRDAALIRLSRSGWAAARPEVAPPAGWPLVAVGQQEQGACLEAHGRRGSRLSARPIVPPRPCVDRAARARGKSIGG